MPELAFLVRPNFHGRVLRLCSMGVGILTVGSTLLMTGAVIWLLVPSPPAPAPGFAYVLCLSGIVPPLSGFVLASSVTPVVGSSSSVTPVVGSSSSISIPLDLLVYGPLIQTPVPL